MLSVTAVDFDAIQTQYTDLGLTDFGDYTIYEIGGTDTLDDNQEYYDFDLAGLQAAIANANTAATAGENVLIVVRTTDVQNTITLAGSQLEIDHSGLGSATIVGWGTDSLTIDADGNSRVFSVGTDSTVAMAGLTITGGNSSDGGGISVSGALTVTHSMIGGNVATGSGGGVYITGNGDVRMTNSVIAGNTADNGGGIYIDGGTIVVVVTNCTIAGNFADNEGGGILLFDGLLTLNNTIVAKNSDDIFDTGTGNLDGSHNLIGDGNGQSVFNDGFDGNIVGLDPLFVDFANGDLRLAKGSPAIDAGDDDLVDLAGTPADLAGKPRKVGDFVDIGAYEHQWLEKPDIAVEATGTDTIIVTWDAVDDADYYEVLLAEDNTFGTGVIWTKTSALSATFAGLIPDKKYFVKVTAVSDATYGDSEAATGNATTDDRLNAPKNLKKVSSTVDTIVVEWDDNLSASGYVVEYWMDGILGGIIYSMNVWTPKATLRGLEADTPYNITVTALGKTGYADSEPSAVETFNTSSVSDTPLPLSKPVVAVTPHGGSTQDQRVVNVSWTMFSTSGVGSYRVEYLTAGMADWSSVGVSMTGATSARVALSANTVYSFRVTAIPSNPATHLSSVSDVEMFKTGDLPLMSSMTITLSPGANPTTEIKVSWNYMSASVSSYTIETSTDGIAWREYAAGLPYGGNASQTHTISGLAPNTIYFVRVLAVTNNAEFYQNTYSAAYVIKTAGGTTTDPLDKPAVTLVADSTTATGATLTWKHINNADAYKVKYDDGGTWKEYSSVILSRAGADWTAVISGLEETTTYQFRVMAVNSAGAFPSSESDSVPVTTLAHVAVAPTIPVLSVASKTDSEIVLHWTKVDGAVKYEIIYTKDANSSAPEGEWNTWTGTGTIAILDNLDDGTEYVFKIRSLDAGEKTRGWSAPFKVTTEALPIILTAPASVSAVPQGTNSIEVSWSQAGAATDYVIEYSTAQNFPAGDVLSKKVSGLSTPLIGLEPNTQYFIRVKAAADGAVDSPWTAPVSATTEKMKLNTPINLLAPATTTSTVELEWLWQAMDIADLNVYFEVEWVVASGFTPNWALATKSDPIPARLSLYQFYTIENLAPNTSYFFRVRAPRNDGRVAPSDWGTPHLNSTKKASLAAVENFGVTTTKRTAELTWTGVSNADDYEIQWIAWNGTDSLTAESTWASAGSGMPENGTCEIANLSPNTQYAFRIRAVSIDGSFISSEWTVKTEQTKVVPPVTNFAVAATQTTAELSWTGADGADNYEIQWVKWTGGGNPNVAADWNAVWAEANEANKGEGSTTDLQYEIDALSSNTLYAFRIRTVDGGFRSAWIVTTKTTDKIPPVKPMDLTATATVGKESTSMSLSWTGMDGAEAYEVEYSLDGGKSWIIGPTTSSTHATINNLAAGVNYVFRVRAASAGGISVDWSDVALATTGGAATDAVAAARPKKAAVGKGGDDKPTISAVTLLMTRDAKNAASEKTVSYIVTCTSDPMLKFTYIITGDKVRIEGLKPGTKYTFAVQAIHENGNVSTAVSVKATTMKFNLIKSVKKPTATPSEGGTGVSVRCTLILNDLERFGISARETTTSYEVYWMPSKTSEAILTTDVITLEGTTGFALTDLAFAGGKPKVTLYIRAVVTDNISGTVIAKSAGAKMTVKLP